MKRYQILKYPWHTGHDYELAKIPHDFYYLTNTPRRWAIEQRPIPESIAWVPHHRAIHTDLAILHVDQWTIDEPSKRMLFSRMKELYDGPRIVINHGSNMVDGCSSKDMRTLVSGCTMLCNSSTALELWEVPGSRCIVHGFSPDEWPQTDYARHDILVTCPFRMRHAAYPNVEGIKRAEAVVPITWIGRDRTFESFAKYRAYLKSSSIFFWPSYASPNPRARAEAMLSGLAIVTTDSHGESEYIQNGVNGFCNNDFDELLEYLKFLYDNPEQVRKLGRAGRATARERFNIDRFAAEWSQLLDDVVS